MNKGGMDNHTAYISVGSNLGSRLDNCQKGIRLLASAYPETAVTGTSSFYRTEPMDFKDQDWFVNAAVKISTPMDPPALLNALKTIQRMAGRKSDTIRYGPRILDLDIIFFDDLVMDTDGLTIPHPRMHERRFVLQPLCDINPELMHPLMKKTVRTLLDMLNGREGKVIPYS